MGTRAESSPAKRRVGISRVRIRHVVLMVTLLYGVTLAVLVGLASTELRAGRNAAARAQQQVRQHDLQAAHGAVVAARRRFGRAEARLGNPLVRVADVVPIIGPNLRVGRSLSAAGVELAQAGEALLGQGAEGTALEALAPRDGALPVERLAAWREPAERAAAHLRSAQLLVDEASSPWLVAPVARARGDFLEVLGDAEGPIVTAAAMTEVLPVFLGAEGRRRYFFGAANPAELRGSGGLVGAYAILTVEDGDLSFSRFGPVQELDDVPADEAVPPSEDFAARYDRYGGAGFWLNINMTPDFPSAATAMENLYQQSEGRRLDGTVVATPAALERLLRVTGPVRVAGVGRVTAGEIVEVVANEAYAEFADNPTRKRLLGAVAVGTFEQFLDTGGQDPVAAARALAGAAGGGDLLLHARDPETQAAFETAGVAGALEATGGDLLAVVGNNAAANKVDFYTDRSITYEVTPRLDGWSSATTTVGMTNNAPTQGPPRYVIGPNQPTLTAGANRTILSTYCAPGCLLHTASQDGEPMPVRTESELGLPVFTSTVSLDSGESTRLRYAWTVPGSWEPRPSGGTYRFTFHDQATIRPTQLELSVVIPDGMEIAHTSHDMTLRDGRATWSGQPSAAQSFEITFRRPLTGVLRNRVRDIWSRPLFG